MSLHTNTAYLFDTRSRQVCRPIPPGAFLQSLARDVFGRYDPAEFGFADAQEARRHWSRCRTAYPNAPQMAPDRVVVVSRGELYALLGHPDPVLDEIVSRARLVPSTGRVPALL